MLVLLLLLEDVDESVCHTSSMFASAYYRLRCLWQNADAAAPLSRIICEMKLWQ